ncbi:MAG: hypothetical protein ABJQ14_09535, partial [Hyphomicrobiales bacterium]
RNGEAAASQVVSVLWAEYFHTPYAPRPVLVQAVVFYRKNNVSEENLLVQKTQRDFFVVFQ